MASPPQLRPEMFRSQRDGRIDRSCRWDKMGHAGFFSRRFEAVWRNFQQFQGRNWKVIQFRKWIHLYMMNERIKINGRNWKASIQIQSRDNKQIQVDRKNFVNLASFGTKMDMIYRTSWQGWIIFHFANSPGGVSASRGVVFARAKSSQWQHALTALEDAWPRDLRVACMQKLPRVQSNKVWRFCWSFVAVQHPDLQRSFDRLFAMVDPPKKRWILATKSSDKTHWKVINMINVIDLLRSFWKRCTWAECCSKYHATVLNRCHVITILSACAIVTQQCYCTGHLNMDRISRHLRFIWSLTCF